MRKIIMREKKYLLSEPPFCTYEYMRISLAVFSGAFCLQNRALYYIIISLRRDVT